MIVEPGSIEGYKPYITKGKYSTFSTETTRGLLGKIQNGKRSFWENNTAYTDPLWANE
jgi:hypothetical protein